jgi:hypothetical protein
VATPTFVKFAPIRHPVAVALERLRSQVFERWDVTIDRIGELRPSHSKFDGGLELVNDKLYEVASEREALEAGQRWHALGLIYRVRGVPAQIYLYFFNAAAASCSFTMSIDESLVYFTSDDYGPGQWLAGFLSAVVAAVEADVCGYGRDNAYEVRHESLDPAQVVERLRDGNLLQIGNPSFHAFVPAIISQRDVKELFNSRPRHRKAKLSVTLAGYSIIYSLP